MNAPPSKALLQAIAVTAELTGTELSKPAARVFADDLARYPEPQVMSSLNRCRRELKGRLTLSDVLTRLEDGRPGPEEAWANSPKDEAMSAMWTDETRMAFFDGAYPLLAEGDPIGARMAFIERYKTLVQKARDAGEPVKWMFSPGTDKSGREVVILDALEKGRISAEAAKKLLPYHRGDEGLNARLLAMTQKALEKPKA